MRIVIVGDGKIGSALAEQLSREGHEITIVDRSETPLQRTVEDLDILSIEGNGATYATQMEAGVDEAELVIAVTAQDELNLLCCLIAKKIGAKHTIARVRNPEYAEELSLISDDLGLSLSVNPELICATEMARTLRIPSAIKTDTFFGGKVELLKFQLPADSPLAGRTLMELPSITKAKVLICAVERGEQEIHIPSGSFRLQAGDRISFVASYAGAQQFFRQMKLAAGRVRSAMLIGGGRIAYYLAKLLGPGFKLTHRSFDMEDMTVEFDETTQCYKIPITGTVGYYRATVVKLFKRSGKLHVTVGYIPTASADDSIINPSSDTPTKYMDYLFERQSGSWYLTGLTESETKPESTASSTAAEPAMMADSEVQDAILATGGETPADSDAASSEAAAASEEADSTAESEAASDAEPQAESAASAAA